MSTHKELREAFSNGALWERFRDESELICEVSARRYPAPKVERPRVVRMSGWNYRIKDGQLQFETSSGTWYNHSQDRAELAALLDLFDHPTELVEAEE